MIIEIFLKLIFAEASGNSGTACHAGADLCPEGDQNYHYENVAFLCDKDGGIISLAPMIDHEFSTYFMFPDDISRHVYWLMELSKSIRGWEVRPGNMIISKIRKNGN